MRLKSIAVLLASLVLIPAAPASAGTLTTQNSCLVSIDGVWHHVNIDFSGTGSPSPVAPGSGLSLTRATARTTIPHYMIDYAGNLGLLKEGENEFPSKVWIAVAAPGTTQGVQVVPVDVVARTTATFSGGVYQSATPIDVTVALPDTAWTAGSAPVGFRQAAGGTLPRLPVGPGGSSVAPLGSVFISSRVGNAVTVNMDCQPGTGEGRDTEIDPTPVAAGAFETVPVDAAAPPTPTVPTQEARRVPAHDPPQAHRHARQRRAGLRGRAVQGHRDGQVRRRDGGQDASSTRSPRARARRTS